MMALMLWAGFVSAQVQCAARYAQDPANYLAQSSLTFPPTAFTVSMWVSSTSSSTFWTTNSLFHLWDYGFGSQPDMQNLRFSASGSSATVTVNNTDSSGSAVVTLLPDGLWHHVALAWTKSTGAWTLYIDTQLALSGTVAAGVSLNTAGFFILGQDMDTSPGTGNIDPLMPFSGYITDVSIWSVALNQTAVIDVFKNLPVPLASTTSGLSAYWPLTDRCSTTGTTTTELVGGKSLTITGGVTWSQQAALPVSLNCALNFGSAAATNRYVEFLNYAWPAARSFTVSMWVKSSLTSWTTGSTTYPITYGTSSTPNLFNFFWAPTGTNFRIAIGSSAISASTTAISIPPDQKWHHVVGTWNGDTVRQFVDGVLLKETTGVQTTLSFGLSGTLVFGQDFDVMPTAYDASTSYDPTQNFRGFLDEVLIDGSFSDTAAVRKLFWGDRSAYSGANYWNFDECSRTRAYSSSYTNALRVANIASNGMWSAPGVVVPRVTSITPLGGQSGTILTIYGSSFGTSSSALSVLLGTTACPISSLVSTTELRCTVPTLSSAGFVDVLLTLNSVSAGSAIQRFEYILAPTVAQTTQLGGFPAGGDVVEVAGSFGFLQSSLAVTFGGTSCPLVSATALTGLLATYYASTTLEASAATAFRIEPNIDFFWLAGKPDPAAPSADSWSARYQGVFVPAETGAHTFCAARIDGVRVYLGGTLIIDGWATTAGVRTENCSTAASLTAGTGVALVVEYYTGTGDAVLSLFYSTGATSKRVVPSSLLRPFQGGALTGHYFSTATLSGAVSAVRFDSQINFSWGTGSPVTGIAARPYSVRWVGFLTAPSGAGLYEFCVTSADGARLMLNGVVMVSDWTAHTSQQTCGTITLPSTAVALLLEFYASTNAAAVLLQYRLNAAGGYITVPSSALSPSPVLDFNSGIFASRAYCASPARSAGAAVVSVTRYGTAASTTASFLYANLPVLSLVSPPAGLSGSTLSLSGAIDSTALSNLLVVADGESCPITAQNTSVVSCIAPSRTVGTTASVFFQLFGRVSAAGASFLYIAAPVVSSSSPAGGQAGTVLVVTGSDFGDGTSATGMRIEVGGVVCPLVPGGSVTTMSCTLPAQAIGTKSIIVYRYLTASTGSATTQYVNAPTVASVSPAGGLIPQVLVVSGSGFGTVAANLAVTVGGLPCTTVRSVSATQLTCDAPLGLGVGQNQVLVALYGVVSPSGPTFSFVRPNVTAISPLGGIAGTVLQIFGSFGPVAALSDLGVTLGGVSCPLVTASVPLGVALSSISCTVPVGTVGLQTVVVIHFAVISVETTRQSFDYLDRPTISAITPNSGTPFTSIVLTGTGFGSDPSRLLVTVGTGTCVNLLMLAPDTVVSCVVPDIASTSLENVTISRYLVASTSPIQFRYATIPIISSISPIGGAAGSSLNITGTFGTGDSCIQSEITATVGGLACPLVAGSLSGCSQLSCTISPLLSPGLLNVIISRFGLSSLPASFQVVAAPTLSSILPLSGLSGDIATIFGSGFGSIPAQLSISFGSLPCPLVALIDDGTVTCAVPFSTGSVSVTVRRLAAVNALPNLSFSYTSTPLLTRISPGGGRTPPLALTLFGAAFGINETAIAISVGGLNCPVVAGSLVGSVSVACQTPFALFPTQPAAYPVLISVRGQPQSNGAISFIYTSTHYVLSVSPISGQAGTNLTVQLNFGSIPGLMQSSIEIFVGGLVCPLVAGSFTGSAVACVAPPNSLGSQSIKSRLFGVDFDVTVPPPTFFYLDTLTISSISPLEATAGTILTIFGAGFGLVENSVNITVGGSVCPVVAGSLNSVGNRVMCTVPLISVSNGPLPLVLNGLQAPTTLFYGASSPVLLSVDPEAGDSSGELHVFGQNFPSLGEVLVFLSDTSCPIVSINTTTIVCIIPELISGNYPVSVLSFAGQTSDSVFFTVFRPTVSAVSPSSGAGGTTITVFGTDFGSSVSLVSVNFRSSFINASCVVIALPSAESIQCALPNLPAPPASPTLLSVFVTVRGVTSLTSAAYRLILAPVITSAYPSEGSSGTVLRLGALNALPGEENQISVTLSARSESLPCQRVFGSGSDSVIKCLAPTFSTYSVDLPSNATAAQFGVSAPAAVSPLFTYILPPVVSRVYPSSAVAGDTLNITGSGFGAASSALAVFLGSVSCLDPTVAAPGSSLSCRIPPNLVMVSSTLPISVYRTGVRSSRPDIPFTFFSAVPTLFSINPAGADVTATNLVLTLRGAAFGSDPAILSVSVGGLPCVIDVGSISISGDQLVCTLAALGGANAPTVLSVTLQRDSSSSNPILFELFFAPQVSSVSPRGGVAGTLVTVQGANFAASGSVWFGTAAAQVLSQNASSIVCIAPQQPLGLASVVVQRERSTSAIVSTASFIYVGASFILDFSPAVAQAGLALQLTGSGFGTETGDLTVLVGNAACSIVSLQAQSSDIQALECTLPSLPVGLHDISVVRFGVVSAAPAPQIEYIVAPYIDSVTPAAGVPGTLITVSGSGFGTAEEALGVSFNNTATELVAASLNNLGTHFVVVAPVVASSGIVWISVSRAAVPTAVPIPFTFIDRPSVRSVAPVGGAAGTTLTLTGVNFGTSESDIRMTVGGTPCAVVPGSLQVSGSDSLVECVAPLGVLGAQDVVLTRFTTLAATPFPTFTYVNTPLLATIAPSFGIAATVITLSGFNFGNSIQAVEVTVMRSSTILGLCAVQTLSETGTQATCGMPSVPSSGPVDVTLSFLGVAGLSHGWTYIEPPVLEATSVQASEPGAVLTLTGQQFGTTESDLSVLIDVFLCSIVPLSLQCGSGGANCSVACTLPEGPGFSQPLTVSLLVGVVSSATTQPLQYLRRPVIDRLRDARLGAGSAVEQQGGAAGQRLYLSGQNFGSQEQMSVQVDGLSCPIQTLDLVQGGTSELSCTVPPVDVSSLPSRIKLVDVVVSRLGVASAPLVGGFAVVERPILTDPIVPGGAPADPAARTQVTLQGALFGDQEDQLQVRWGPYEMRISNGSLLGGSQLVVVMVSPSFGEAVDYVKISRFAATSDVSPLALFSFVRRPVVSSLDPAGGGFGTTVVVTGNGFGTSEDDLAATLRGVSCVLVSGSLATTGSLQTFNCTIPAVGIAYGLAPLLVSLFSIESVEEGPQFNLVRQPSLADASPIAGTAGQTVSLTGSNLGTLERDVVVLFGTPGGDAECVLAPGSLAADESSLECVVPAPVEGGVPVAQILVRHFNQESANVTFRYIEAPEITSVTPVGGASGRGASHVLTVGGSHFGSDQSVVRVLVNGAPCTVQTLEDTVLTCTIASDFVGPADVVVYVYETPSQLVVGSEPVQFVFVKPALVLKVSPEGGFSGDFVDLVVQGLPTVNTTTLAAHLAVRIGSHKCAVMPSSVLVGTLGEVTLSCALGKILQSEDGSHEVVLSYYGVDAQEPYPEFTLVYDVFWVRWSSPVAQFFISMTVIAFVLMTGGAYAIFYHRDHPQVRIAGLPFLVAILIGMTGQLAGVLSLIGRPTNSLCLASFWLPPVSLMLSLSSLIVKNFRTFRIIWNKSSNRIEVSMSQMIEQAALITLGLAALLFVGSLDRPPIPTIFYGNPTYLRCYSQPSAFYILIASGYRFALLAFGIYISWSIRRASTRFNESKHITFSIYNIAFVTSIVVPIVLTIESVMARFAMQAIGDLLIVYGLLFVFFLKKTHGILYGADLPEHVAATPMFRPSRVWSKTRSESTGTQGGYEMEDFHWARSDSIPNIADTGTWTDVTPSLKLEEEPTTAH
eukprot:TRINITY_DN645_c0_g1_i3.p1 TRINITY_DN645_c0_g1~~TRINITY_DN645_c0_g1_i3.p1  ORF type:complete len:3751 (+),score=683.12 TRINITY_DN645_c0_g1_i3:3-11255(+)